jgi:DNA adenine methylase
MVKYITRYVDEHYKPVKIRRDLAERLHSLARERGVTIQQLLEEFLSAYLDTNMGAKKIVDEVAEDVVKYIEASYRPVQVKLIRYAGGDYFIFDDLNKFFMMAPATTFVEVFGGSCHSSLNVSRSKFNVIVCNDIDSVLINLFKLVKENPQELKKRLALLPFSREMLKIAEMLIDDRDVDIVTKSVLLFYITRASMFSALTMRGFAVSKEHNHAYDYANAIAAIKNYVKKARDVAFENKDFREIVKLYDSPHTLFYLDPPYVSARPSQGREEYYRYTFTVNDLRQMATLLRSVKGYFVLKMHEDNYRLIKGLLPKHNVAVIEKKQSLLKVKGEERPVWKLVVAYNFGANKKLF